MTKTNIFFFLLVFLLSVPFWILGSFISTAGIISINLPFAALMLLCPITAAILLTRKAGKVNGVKLLLNRIADYKKIQNPVWYIPAFSLMPTLMLSVYAIMRWLNIPMPKPNIHLTETALLFILFFVGAICEEIGWTGYITDPLQNRYGAFNAALLIGIVWAVWHIIPFIQAHRSPEWIFWQCTSIVALRIIIVWLYNSAGRSVLTAIIFHTTVNVSEYLFPNYGSHYDPFYFAILLIITVAFITYFGGPKTLSQYRIS